MACYSVLRIGPMDLENGSADKLKSAISTYFGSKTILHGGNSSNDTKDERNCLTISNRYFDADVLLLGLNESTEKLNEDCNEQCHFQEDGIVLVFDSSVTFSSTSSSSSVNPFVSLGRLHESAETMNRAGDLLRLCVGVTFGASPLSDGSKKSEQEYSRRVLWCLDRGYEYVEADLTSEGMKAGHDDRDKEGFARIIEAISSCMWSSHVMKSKRAVSKVDNSTPAAPKVTNCLTSAETLTTDEKNSPQQNIDSDESREAEAVATLMKGVQDESNTNNDPSEDSVEQMRQEVAFNELEHVITEAKRIREASQSNSMTDEERRQRAGDTAMRLMGLLGKIGFDDDEGDETDASSVEDSGTQ